MPQFLAEGTWAVWSVIWRWCCWCAVLSGVCKHCSLIVMLYLWTVCACVCCSKQRRVAKVWWHSALILGTLVTASQRWAHARLSRRQRQYIIRLQLSLVGFCDCRESLMSERCGRFTWIKLHDIRLSHITSFSAFPPYASACLSCCILQAALLPALMACKLQLL